VDQSVGVFGQDVLLWVCLLRQSQQRPQPHLVHQHANQLLDELKRTREALQLPVQSVEDGLYAICALIDEIAMSFPDLRPMWQQYQLQATRHNSSNAGVEVFQRLQRVRVGPPSVVATYFAVLGIGFMGCYGLPGADRYALVQLRRDLARQLGVDPDRDWNSGVIKPIRADDVAQLEMFRQPWYKSLWLGRALGALVLLSAIATLVVRFVS
jgi:type VI secretion system protein ImpK